jgi:hypothetical protein
VRDVPDPRPADERQDVVFADADERDRTLDDLSELAVGAATAFGRERGEELGIALVAVGRVVDRPEEASGRVPGAGRAEVETERGQDLGGIALIARPVRLRHLAGQGSRRQGEKVVCLGDDRRRVAVRRLRHGEASFDGRRRTGSPDASITSAC